MNVFRIKINPSGGDADLSDTFQYCLDNNVLGIGWDVHDELSATRNWTEYEEKAMQRYDNINPVAYIKNNVAEDDLVWTRGVGDEHAGKHFLARIESGWEYYDPSLVANGQRYGVENIFRCASIYEVEADQVPGKVVSSFNGRGNVVQRVSGKHILEYSKYMWNQFQKFYPIDKSNMTLFDMLDAEEAEDILFLYLQYKGWRVIPHSRKGSTMKFEFLAKHLTTGELAYTQVKIGDTEINREQYKSGRWFLWQLNEHYTGTDADNVTCITRNEIKDFIESGEKWLPGWLNNKRNSFHFE